MYSSDKRRLKFARTMQQLKPVPWGAVTGTAEKIIIVASGPSLKDVPASAIENAGAFIIAVNMAIIHVQAQAFFTCDPDPKVFPLLGKRRAGCTYYAAVPTDYGTHRARLSWHRRSPIDGVTYLRRVTGDGPLKSCYGLSDDPTAIHTGNSAYGALGVAYLMKPKKVLLLGVDATSYGYAWDQGSPKTLSHLPELFASAVPQLHGVDVVNGSIASQVRCFDLMTPESGLKWISNA